MSYKTVNNFVGASPVAVGLVEHHGETYVILSQYAGGMNFQHTMKQQQALELANALLDAAMEVEKS